KAEHFTGAPGESLLTVSGGQLPCQRIFLFGVGAPGDLQRAAPGAWAADAFAAVARAGGTRVATAPPAGDGAPIAAVARALVEAARAAALAELVLLHADVRA